ncbi:MAG TPA: hypothetical protein DD803_10065, partial [Alcaligenes faecalis]
IAANAVTADKIQAGTITAESGVIANGAITNAHLNNAIVTTAKIADGAISRAKIQDAAISVAKIQNAAITSAKIQNAAIKAAHIGHAEIDTVRIAGHAVTIQSSLFIPQVRGTGSVYERHFEMSVYYPHPTQTSVMLQVNDFFDNAIHIEQWSKYVEVSVNGARAARSGQGYALTKVDLPAGQHVIRVRQGRFAVDKVSGESLYTDATLVLLSTMR